MESIAVNVPVLLLVGLPQSFLTLLALHVFTETKINIKKYIFLSLAFTVIGYLIRFLPIALGVNTVLTFLALIIAFQFAYKQQLSKAIRTIVATVVSFLMISVSEVLNMLLWTVVYDQQKATELIYSSDDLTKGLTSAPSNIFFAVFILIGYFVLKQFKKRKRKDGEDNTQTGS